MGGGVEGLVGLSVTNGGRSVGQLNSSEASLQSFLLLQRKLPSMQTPFEHWNWFVRQATDTKRKKQK
jgi:hypothetical protein